VELKIYLRVLLKKWWIVSPAFLVTITATIVLTFTQAPTYRSVATFIVAPGRSFEDMRSFVSGLDTLSKRAEIASTYAEVASSRMIKSQAASELGLTADEKRSLTVESQLLAGTNVIEIAVEGNDPLLVRDFANMVGEKTIVYVEELYEVYDLKPLDPAITPAAPVKPNKVLNLALGVFSGLVLGGGLAFFSEYLQTPLESIANLSILDEQTGAYNKEYFRQRLAEEMSRAKRNRYPLSLVLMDVDQLKTTRATSFHEYGEVLRRVTVFLRQSLRREDIIARIEGTVFAFLLPDTPEEEAKATMEQLQTRLSWNPFEIERSGIKLNLNGTAGIVAYQHNGTTPDEFLSQASHVLQQAEAAGYGKVYTLSELSPEENGEGEYGTGPQR